MYGPQGREEKLDFLRQIAARRALCQGPWLLLGDFNMIRRASEKNNSNLDRGLMVSFNRFIGQHELKELYMHGRLFTWSNGRETPTMSKLDRMLASVDWDLMYPDSLLQALSSSTSDHALLHLSLNAGFRPKHRFKFELFWANLEGFQEAVAEAWVCDPAITDPYKRLDELFRNTASFLQSWGQRKTGNIKLRIAMANVLILRFEVAQERRQLTAEELWLLKSLKLVVLGLSSVERTIARQRSRVRWLQEGDANTKLFHAFPTVRLGEELCTDQAAKEDAFFGAYRDLLGVIRNREHALNLENLGLLPIELEGLDCLFT